MGDQTFQEMDSARSYREILAEGYLKYVFLVASVLFAGVWVGYVAMVAHIQIMPIFSGEVAARIASKPNFGYYLNAVVWGLLSLAMLWEYLRRR